MNYYGKVCTKHPELIGERNRRGNCIQCNRDSAKASYWADPEKSAKRNKAWVSENPEARRKHTKKYYDNNKEDIAKRTTSWYLSNRDRVRTNKQEWHCDNKDIVNERSREWRLANPERAKTQAFEWARNNAAKVNTKTARRRASKLRATPLWFNEFVVAEVYELAVLRTRATGVLHQVDHIVPLQSDLVCGLHTHHNLQVITKTENIAKNNRYWPDMP